MTSRKRRRTQQSDEPEQLSAAERYRLAMERNRFEKTERAQFALGYDFNFDDFQLSALEKVEEGENVLVAAPTGAGKTIVGEFALHMALTRQTRAFYTTPIKALSNQKYRELRDQFGDENVGLLTGDTSINGDAPVVVMTTEVARNMIYSGKDLSDLGAIVLDEVHYLADRFRGPVWEEVIIHMPSHVQLVALSATVSNAEEFGDWIDQVRGGCSIVVSETRPVPLYQHMMVGRHLYDLYTPDRDGRHVLQGKINPQLYSAISDWRGIESRSKYDSDRGLAGGRRIRGSRTRARRVSKPEVVISLDRAHLLPAIFFIFSRAACDDAVDAVVGAGVTLTTREEQQQIAAVVDEAVSTLSAEDMSVLGIAKWSAALEAGVAAHHAGLLPVLKETIETLFAAGLIKVVFATETLALGINMPARTVVLDSLRKFNGVTHVSLSPGEYTQLTGRAGRRGIDVEGHAVVVHGYDIEPEEVAALASKRTYPLVSAFRPTYNMVANLAATGTLTQAREVMEESFAQFQADRKVVGLARDARQAKERMKELDGYFNCEFGDAKEYFVARDDLTRLQKETAKQRNIARVHEVERDILKLNVGDVISLAGGKRPTDAVVTRGPRQGRRGPSVQAIGADGRIEQVTADSMPQGVSIVGNMRIKKNHLRRPGRFKAAISSDLRNMRRSGRLGAPKRKKLRIPRHIQSQLDRLENEVRNHPVHKCPDRDEHARAARPWLNARRDYLRLTDQVDAQTSSVAVRFDKIAQVLENVGALHGGEITEAGEVLRGIYGEKDLVIALSIRAGIWNDLNAAQLAAIVSTCVFEPRKDHDPDTEIPGGENGELARALRDTELVLKDINRAENDAHAPSTEPLEYGILSAIYWWVLGDSLATAVQASDLEAGDWVRWCRQVIDALGQVASAAPAPLNKTARMAQDAIRRSVVALAEAS
ncbi:MAG: DEAD/DEAH box helicase [Actinomycetaceae bacterium]|nr:DEAD/DEAH box helicase [Actinomycetaceae bacterium]